MLKLEIKLKDGKDKHVDVVKMTETDIYNQLNENEFIMLLLKGESLFLKCSDIKEVKILF